MAKDFLRKNRLTRKLIYTGGKYRAKRTIGKISKYLTESESILDVGSGTCNIAEILKQRNHEITPLDIQNLSFCRNVEPVIFDGDRIPFEENKFDVALLLLVLHHTPNPHKILAEVSRVAKKIIIIEEIYSTPIQRKLTFFWDSVVNLEFASHPHSNKSDDEWRQLFEDLRLKVLDSNYHTGVLSPFLKQVTYYLESTN
jgi:ubiquinone/menaquinone biosynthesis C-methylase UbiE